MALHVDKNGVGAVTPNYLYHQNGTVPDPMQRSGQIAHLPNASGESGSHRYAAGNPFFNRVASLIAGTHK